MQASFTTRQSAAAINQLPGLVGTVEEWQVRRLFEDGDLPDPPRFGGKRMIDPTILPIIVAAMVKRGWIGGIETPATDQQ